MYACDSLDMCIIGPEVKAILAMTERLKKQTEHLKSISVVKEDLAAQLQV